MQIAATAEDESGVRAIYIYVDNSLKKTCSNVTSCSIWYKLPKAGLHTITVVSIDKSMNTKSNACTIKVM